MAEHPASSSLPSKRNLTQRTRVTPTKAGWQQAGGGREGHSSKPSVPDSPSCPVADAGQPNLHPFPFFTFPLLTLLAHRLEQSSPTGVWGRTTLRPSGNSSAFIQTCHRPLPASSSACSNRLASLSQLHDYAKGPRTGCLPSPKHREKAKRKRRVKRDTPKKKILL